MASEEDRELAAALVLAGKLGVLGYTHLVDRLDREIAARGEPEKWLIEGSLAAGMHDLLQVLEDVAQGHRLLRDPVSVLDLLGMAMDARRIEEPSIVSRACATSYDPQLPEDLAWLVSELVFAVDEANDPAWERDSSIKMRQRANDAVAHHLRTLLERSRGRSAWSRTLEYVCHMKDAG